MEEQLVLEALFSAELCAVQEAEEKDSDESSEGEVHPLVEELQASLQSLFDACGSFPVLPSPEKYVVQPLKHLPCETFSDSLVSWVRSTHRVLLSRLTSVQKLLSTRLISAEKSSQLASKLLKSREELLDSISEELYFTQLEKAGELSPGLSSPPSSLPLSSRRTEGSVFGKSLFEVEEADCESEKKLADVLRLDALRQRIVLSHCIEMWKHASPGSGTPTNESMEGRYKREILQRNPLAGRSQRTVQKLLPPAYLFHQLFTFLDHCAYEIDAHSPFSCVKCLTEGNVQKRIASEVISGLDALSAYYSEDSMLAGLFARLLHVYDPDPVLSAPSKELVRLNASLKTLTIRRSSIRDWEAGGMIPIRDALTFAFSLCFATNPPLMNHFLQAIAPAELETREWEEYVTCVKKKLSAGHKPVLGDDITESWKVASDLLEVGRGELLGSFLQVYDLYVDQLYVLVASHSVTNRITSVCFRALVSSLCGSVSPERLDELWTQAQVFSLCSDSDSVLQDAALLALITSSCSEIAAKPLTPLRKTMTLTIRTELSEESDEASSTVGSAYSKGRTLFTPRGRQSVRRPFASDISF